ncbi:hypothetical protein ACOMHN_065323 [Nucella lapillus]
MGEVPTLVEPTASDDNNNDSNKIDCSNNNNSNNSGVVSGLKAGGSVSRLPAIKEKRSSVQKKARTTSVIEAPMDNSTTISTTTDLPTISPSTTTTLQRQESTTSTTTSPLQCRASVPQYLNAQISVTQKVSKPSFAGIGRRVSNMVRARIAFQNRRKTSTTNADEPNHMEHIHEMPRNPRFTTYLSAEAQYAVMKGYEDMLYDKIAKTNPESRLILKRTKTPFRKTVSIVGGDLGAGEGGGGGKKFAPSPAGSQSINTTSPNPTTPLSPESAEDIPDPLDDEGPGEAQATSTPFPPPKPDRKPARTQSTLSSDVSKSMTTSSGGRAGGGVGWALHRSSSLPMLDAGLSHQRRLVLTYRLESAMDILDTLKRRNKENSLSPRVFRIPRQVDAVRDFNSWTKVWNKEFKVAHGK